MYYRIAPTTSLHGDVNVPGSKCQTARGLILATLAEGTSHILNPMPGIDNYSIAECCRRLGAKVDTSNVKDWVVTSPGLKNLKCPGAVLDVGNSGTGLYFLSTLAAFVPGKTVVTGDYQICYRPIAPLLEGMRMMGAECISTRSNELAPLVIGGPVHGGVDIPMDGSNEQWIIGLLVCCPSLEEDTTIHFTSTLGERPYVDLTVDWMNAAGVTMINENYEKFIIPGGQKYHSFTKATASDWCSASYPMVAAAIMKEKCQIKLLDMDIHDFQGERHYVDWINEMGGHVEVLNDGKDGVIIEGGHELHGIEIDCGDVPDAVPALSVLGCYCTSGKMVLRNLRACRMKETDRAKTIAGELRKMGANIEEGPDSVTIYPSKLHGATLDGHHDHRIVMASTVAALGADGETWIDSAEHVGVSFPRFFEEMKAIGANISRLTEE